MEVNSIATVGNSGSSADFLLPPGLIIGNRVYITLFQTGSAGTERFQVNSPGWLQVTPDGEQGQVPAIGIFYRVVDGLEPVDGGGNPIVSVTMPASTGTSNSVAWQTTAFDPLVVPVYTGINFADTLNPDAPNVVFPWGATVPTDVYTGFTVDYDTGTDGLDVGANNGGLPTDYVLVNSAEDVADGATFIARRTVTQGNLDADAFTLIRSQQSKAFSLAEKSGAPAVTYTATSAPVQDLAGNLQNGLSVNYRAWQNVIGANDLVDSNRVGSNTATLDSQGRIVITGLASPAEVVVMLDQPGDILLPSGLVVFDVITPVLAF